MTKPPAADTFSAHPSTSALPDEAFLPKETWRDSTIPLFVVDTLTEAQQLCELGFPSVAFTGIEHAEHVNWRDRHVCIALSTTPEADELAFAELVAARKGGGELKGLAPQKHGAIVRRARLTPPTTLLTYAQHEGKNGVLRVRMNAPPFFSVLDEGRFALLCRLVEQRDDDGAICLPVREAESGRLRWNEMSQMPTLDEDLISDGDTARLRHHLSTRGHDYSSDDIWAAVAMVAQKDRYHPVRSYLTSLKWDGEERLCRVASEILHAAYESTEDMLLNFRLLYCFFLGAVARAFEPGCTMQTSLVLVGVQGALKSTFFKVLASEKFFCDTNLDIHNSKDTPMMMSTAWIIEWAELETLRRARELTLVKSFMSSPEDTFRPPWGRNVIKLKRSSVFVGTTNDAEFLTDSTGNRRWHLIMTGPSIDLDKLKSWRDQLWAEVVVKYEQGARDWYLSAAENKLLAVRQEREHFADHPWAQAVHRWLHENHASATPSPVTIEAILEHAIEKELAQTTTGEQRSVGNILTRAGWTKSRKQREGVRRNVWDPPADWQWTAAAPSAPVSDADERIPF